MEGDIIVQAIDASEVEPVRDAAMSRNIMSAVSLEKYDEILVLVGNVKVIKTFNDTVALCVQGDTSQGIVGKPLPGCTQNIFQHFI